jgi:hypothetical protein
VSVERDEEHNRYLLRVEDRSSGYPRQLTIGVDFVTAGEYRTLLAIHLLSVAMLLIWFPFGKLMHTFLFLFSRGATGARLAHRGAKV